MLIKWCGFCWYNLKWLYKGEQKQNGPDMKLIKQLVQENICVIAEGKIHTPEQARQIKKLGVAVNCRWWCNYTTTRNY